MKRFKKIDYDKMLIGDFETTVYEGQTKTEVWASALVELYTEDVIILHSIEETFEYLRSLDCNIQMWYHNLKFDGEFWLYYLTCVLKMKQAYTKLNDTGTDVEFISIQDMPNETYRYTISDMGQWYEIIIKTNGHYICIRDSLKLMPYSVREIGKGFGTKHKKLEMEYKGYRYAGCEITEEEKEYIANDVLVVKEAMEIMFDGGHDKMTIGACCLDEFKKNFDFHDYDMLFPDLSQYKLNKDIYDTSNADEYIRKSYSGGWCYVVAGKENKLYYNGTTADVNSLYPSVMSAKSDNYYPVGKPIFWRGKIPYAEWRKHDKKKEDIFYFVRFRCRFHIKEGMLPFIHIRGVARYNSTENLKTSDVRDKNTGEYFRYYKDYDGKIYDSTVELTLTMYDFELFKKHYYIEDLEYIDGCYFNTLHAASIFEVYISKYRKMKLEATTKAMRTEAKLFLNNLYGKFASSCVSNFRVAIDIDGDLKFFTVEANNKKIGYIPIGSAITSYARCFTITAAQANYYGEDKPGFIYADTDSIHCDLLPEQMKGIEVDDKEFCCWKLEACWDVAIFARQKTYIEHVTHENLEKIDKPYYNVKCAGMPQKCKDLFIRSFYDISKEELEAYSPEEQKFLKTRRTLKDFKKGLKIPGKLLPRHIDGGIILVDTTYEMR